MKKFTIKESADFKLSNTPGNYKESNRDNALNNSKCVAFIDDAFK